MTLLSHPICTLRSDGTKNVRSSGGSRHVNWARVRDRGACKLIATRGHLLLKLGSNLAKNLLGTPAH